MLNALLIDKHKKRLDKIKKRLSLQQAITAPKSKELQGAISKVNQINSYNPEAVAAELIVDLFILVFQFCFNIPYLRDKMQYNSLLKQELASLQRGERLRLVYEPDENGVFPTIYPVEGDEVKVDQAPVDRGQVTDFMIRKNGYIPRPSYFKGLEDALNLHIEAILGSNMLSQEQLIRLHGALSQEKKENKNNNDNDRPPNDVAQNLAAARAPRLVPQAH